MSVELLGKPVTGRTTGTFGANDAVNANVPLYLVGDESNDGPIGTYGKSDATNQAVVGKLGNVDKGGDALNIVSVDGNGNVTYGDLISVYSSGTVAFTKGDGTVTQAGVDGDVGKGVEGVGTNGVHVAVASTGGNGRIVTFDGSTLYVDLDKDPLA